jgi:hypothetical protein
MLSFTVLFVFFSATVSKSVTLSGGNATAIQVLMFPNYTGLFS